MKLSKRRHGSGLAMNMTPMIDVTFLLLIFFMTVTQVSAVNKEVLELPALEGSLDQEETAITINIDQYGDIRVGGERRMVPELVSLVSDELASVGGDPLRVSVALRADRRGNCRSINQVISALKGLGIGHVRLAVEKPQ